MRKLMLGAAAGLMMSSLAFAQNTTNNMTEAQLKQHLQHEGYSNVTLKPMQSRALSPGGTAANTKNQPRVYAGTATKDGQQIKFEIDSTGHITQQ
jgi:hypothetical protein